MSEQINLNTNNLYVTEEAFENFQANSIYEESEYITLSDIVPPQPASSDLICTIDEVPSESEIVSSSVLDYTTQDVNNAPHSSTDGDILPKIVSETVEYLEYDTSTPIDYENSNNLIVEEPENTPISGSQQIENIQTTKPAKRRRKNKTLNLQSSNITNSVDSNENLNANKNITNNDSLKNLTLSNSVTRNTPKRRGRKSKKIQNDVNIISLTNTTSETYDHNIKYVQKKKGRKSKKVQNETNKLGAQEIIESNASSKDNTINSVTHDNSISEGYNQGKKCVIVTTRKSRGKRNQKIQNQTDKDLQLQSTNVNLPLSQNNTIDDISLDNMVSEAHTSEKDLNSVIENAPKKRGRKKKIHNETANDLQIESTINNSATCTEKPLKTSNTLENDINTSKPLNSSNTELQNSQVSSNETKRISRKDRSHKNISISEQETLADDNLEPHNNYKNQKGNKFDSSDEDDDISLNKLKQTLDVKVDEEIDNTEIVDMEIEIDNIVNVTVVDNNIDMPSVSVDQDTAFEHKEDSERDQSALEKVTPSKRSSKMSVMSDFEYNIDKVVKETLDMDDLQPEKNENDDLDNSLLTEDLSKRPSRRKTKKTLHYEEDSDEDPFANVELSDEEPRRNRKKGYRYDSDDEYVPGNKIGKTDHISSDSSDSTSNEALGEIKKQARKRTRKRLDTSSQSKSPRKRSKKYDTESSVSSIGHTLDVTTIPPDSSCQIGDNNDIEVCLESSVIKINEDVSQKSSAKTWGAINEFENFIAKKIQGTDVKIKKVSSTSPSDSVIAPLEIPVINPETKKSVEMCTQTLIQSTSCSVQTTTPYSLPMKTNVQLTKEQSGRACEFLKGVVKTTAELGQLMTQKSEDFITKKINTAHVTDTFKMDYCVQKSFLLFKLAKHNLVQMEEDLAKQYEEFLEENNLSACREKQKNIEPRNRKVENSDSDCEIVEVSTQSTKEKPKFNPKTVFLNKELSIKIAKKSAEGGKQKDTNKLNIKGRRTVWINDSVMVKKVKPNQSFLAQDSRNKKPPDNIITEKMVSDFFKEYYRTKVLSTCASFTSKEWLHIEQNYICNYFFVKPTTSISAGEQFSENRDNARDIKTTVIQKDEIVHPKTLFSLCTMVLQQKGYILKHDSNKPFIDNKQLSDLSNYNPKTLFQLCLNIAMTKIKQSSTNHSMGTSEGVILNPLPLKTLSYQQVVQLIFENGVCKGNKSKTESLSMINNDDKHNLTSSNNIYKGASNVSITAVKSNQMKSLFSLCVELLQNEQNMCIVKDFDKSRYTISSPSYLHSSYMENSNEIQHISVNKTPYTYNASSLRNIAFKNVEQIMYKKMHYDSNHDSVSQRPSVPDNAVVGCKVKKLADICFDIISTHFNDDDMFHDVDTTTSLTIDNVNTVSEEVFHNMDETSLDYQRHSPYADDEQTIYYEDEEDELEPAFEDEEQTEDSNWVSQVQMKELRSCVSPGPTDSEQQCVDEGRAVPNIVSFTPQIKIEPEEAVIDPIIIKSEPMHNLDEMTVIPENVITKIENTELPTRDPIQRQESSSYDEDAFEAFVRSNKMLNVDDTTDQYDKAIFSQSALRVRRQHEPDSDNENDSSMSLLIPQTYEPLHIDTAKKGLMQSSDDDDGNKSKKNIEKKAKRKTRPKKSDVKCNNKDMTATSKEKPQSNNEVAILTRRMKEKIRQEERKNDSSDSETENLSLKLMKDNNEKKRSLRSSKIDDEIQCNNVDSTQQVSENTNNKSTTVKDIENSTFTGFSAVDQNEISNYEKYVKFVYNKIIPDGASKNLEEEQQVSQNNLASKEICSENMNTGHGHPQSPLINPEEPVELLECEPSMPIFDDIIKPKSLKKKSLVSQAKMEENNTKESELKQLETSTPIYIERHGWKCYPIDGNDPKLYQLVQVVLEKLPESFIKTYFKYQNVTDKSKDDTEVDRLTNLQSLNKLSNTRESKNKLKNKATIEQIKSGQASSTSSRAASPANNEHYNELSPSEDEGANIEDELPPPTIRQTTENNLAKTSLMKDNDSDVEGDITIKPEPQDDKAPKRKLRAGPKSQTKDNVKIEPTDSLMLTADKMMNKELTLLHAPIVLDEKVSDAAVKGQNNKNKHKYNSRSHTNRDRQKSDDSSSEEEKQWVNTKEKLLKRMVKRQESTSMDDAKHAKLVSEFIERRGEVTRKKKIGRKRRSRKHLIEHEKQLRVLSNELYGEGSTHAGKKCSQAYYKGRRNIRKVLDKKSLTRRTVVANMEEFERKRRLISRQNKLRELLGYEEGVNVLVINDEVCLEYDFEDNRPVVTVHPFFTRVMKAHQYEGVKFMWDACFESLEYVESGHPGSGCILAHCMGLGKTLQVLALLHTVLTHPRVGMQRVLVCCPLSTVLNWVDEIHKWIGPVTTQIKVFELSKLKKTYERAYQLEDWYNGGGIFIIGYELFRSLTTLDPELDDVRPTIINKIRTALLDPGPDIIVCDEGHLLKNDCSVLAVAMSRVATKRRIVLTGTPMQNNLREYYCMVNFIKPNLLGTYSEYSNRFENPIMNGQHRDSREEDIRLMKARTHILHKVLEGCLQRQEASVLYPYLPKKYEYTVFITPTDCQSDLYNHYMQHYAKKNKQSLLKDFHVLQKIWTHPQVLHNFQMRREESVNKVKAEKLEDDLANEELSAIEMKPSDTEIWWLQYLEGGGMLDSLHSSNKFVAVFQILDECVELGDKVLIFSTSLFTMDALEYFLRTRNKWRLGHEYYRLDGSVPAEVRQKWCREFNAEHNLKTKLFLISTRAGSLGLNMTAANRVIILDTSWNPAHDIQSIFRVYRFGQKKDCYIYRLVAMGTMEQKIYERSVTKQAVACRVVDEQQIDRHYNSAELTELYSFDESGCGVAAGVAAGVTDVVLLRVARDSALHAVHEHDSLLRGSAEQGLPEHERAAAWMQFQQEHSNNQMQTELLPNLPKKSPLKKSTDDAKASTSKETPEIKIENEIQDTEPCEPKAKKGKKDEVMRHDIPIQTPDKGPSEEYVQDQPVNLDYEKEHNIVKKITDILIKHNFQNRNGHKQISNLVQRVREIVTTKKITNLPITDGLAENIAMVFLQKEKQSYAEISSSIDENVLSNEAHLESTKKRGRPTKRRKILAHDEYIPPGPLNVTPESGEDSERRVRRKAALAAKKHLDTIALDSLEEIDGDEWQINNSDTDSVPETDIISYEKNSSLQLEDNKTETRTGNGNKKEQTPKTIGRPRKIIVSRVMKNNIKKNMKTDTDVIPSRQARDNIKKNKEPIISEMESILLSDDDEPIKKSNPPKKKSMKPEPKSASVETPNNSKGVEVRVESDDNEVVPLDPYILTNENFVKVVAHTYLTGNPMLDEDAALLAAQYSTQKAIKEMEKAGKSEITSGPIYDIAVKVLGKDVLRNFQKSYSQSKTARGSMSAQQVAQQQNTAIMESNSLLDEMQETKPKVPHVKVKNKRPSRKVMMTPTPPPELDVSIASAHPTSTATAAQRDTRHTTAPRSLLPPATQSLYIPATQSSPTTVPTPRFRVIIPQRPAVAPKFPATVPLPNLVTGPQPRLVHATETQAPVVPVGFFKRSENLPTTQSLVQSIDEECILPDDDDDDVRIISDVLPPMPGLGAAAPPVFTSLPSSSSVVPSPGPALVSTSEITSLPSANPTFVRRNSRPLILTNVTAKATSKSKNENIALRYVPIAPRPLQTKGLPILASQSQKMPILKVDSGKVILAIGDGAKKVCQRTKVPATTSESDDMMCINDKAVLSTNESTTVLAVGDGGDNVQQRTSVSTTVPESTDTICLDSDEEPESSNPQPSFASAVAPTAGTAVPVMLTSSIANSQAVPVSLVVNPLGLAGNSTMTGDEFILSQSMPIPQINELIDSNVNSTNISNSTSVLPDTQIETSKLSKPTETVPVNSGETPTPSSDRQPRLVKRLTRVERPFPSPIGTGTAKKMETKQPEQKKPAMKTVCKPGDIIRITKTGVEILNRSTHNDDVSNEKVPSTAPSGDSNAVNQTSGEKALAPEEATPSGARTHTLSVSSSASSDSSRAPSPEPTDDPLSIFKNVVHIQADVYENSTSKKRMHTGSADKVKSDKLGDSKEGRDGLKVRKPDSTTIKVSGKRSQSATTSSVAVKNTSSKNSTNRHVNVTGPTIVINDDLPSIPPKNTPSTYKNAPSTSKNTLASTTSSVSSDKLQKSQSSVLKVKRTTKPSNTTVIGTSKNIVISNVSKPTLTKTPTPSASTSNNASPRIVRVTNVTTIASNKTTQKRPSEQTITTTIKKKRTAEPMSLKDFDIDDIDDIIELE